LRHGRIGRLHGELEGPVTVTVTLYSPAELRAATLDVDETTTPVAARGVRLLCRCPVLLVSTVRRMRRLRVSRWSPLQLLRRIVAAYLNSLLPQSPEVARKYASSPPRLRRAASKLGEVEYRRSVMLNFCVAEVLQRSSSVVRRSPLAAAKRGCS
jgi:hypothetical protein